MKIRGSPQNTSEVVCCTDTLITNPCTMLALLKVTKQSRHRIKELVISIVQPQLKHFRTNIHSLLYNERCADLKIENDAIFKQFHWLLVM